MARVDKDVYLLSIVTRLFESELRSYSSRDDVPELAAGIYALWSHGKIVYIGQSIQVRRRLNGGHQAMKNRDITHIDVIPVWTDDNKATAIESALIWLINPELNIAGRRKQEKVPSFWQ